MVQLTVLIAIFSNWAKASTLDGFWFRACQNGVVQTQEFSGAQNFADELFFEDANCTRPLMTFTNSGFSRYQGQNIDFQFESVSLLVASDRMVMDYNNRKVCGKNDWQKNSRVVITGLQCALFQNNRLVQIPRKGDMRYGIWKVESTRLFFGRLSQQEDGTVPSKRPTQWDTRAYIKQF
jgi:hypothetical protein